MGRKYYINLVWDYVWPARHYLLPFDDLASLAHVNLALEPEIRLPKLTLGIATSKVIDTSNPRRRNIEGHCRQLP